MLSLSVECSEAGIGVWIGWARPRMFATTDWVCNRLLDTLVWLTDDAAGSAVGC
jgi:hypothetical protein